MARAATNTLRVSSLTLAFRLLRRAVVRFDVPVFREVVFLLVFDEVRRVPAIAT